MHWPASSEGRQSVSSSLVADQRWVESFPFILGNSDKEQIAFAPKVCHVLHIPGGNNKETVKTSLELKKG